MVDASCSTGRGSWYLYCGCRAVLPVAIRGLSIATGVWRVCAHQKTRNEGQGHDTRGLKGFFIALIFGNSVSRRIPRLSAGNLGRLDEISGKSGLFGVCTGCTASASPALAHGSLRVTSAKSHRTGRRTTSSCGSVASYPVAHLLQRQNTAVCRRPKSRNHQTSGPRTKPQFRRPKVSRLVPRDIRKSPKHEIALLDLYNSQQCWNVFVIVADSISQFYSTDEMFIWGSEEVITIS
jgi:hypothetical protein